MSTMRRWIDAAADRTRGRDEGMGLILVIGVSVLVFALAATAVSIALNALSQSRQRTGFEVSLAVAEGGVDRVLSEVQGAYTATNSDYPAPGPASTWCTGAVVNFPVTGDGVNGVFSTEAAERTWARTELEALLSAGTCIQTDEKGQYIVLKPPSANVKYGKVYSLSAVPSFADADRTRLIKSEYIFMPYRPTHAILAQGPLSIASSTTVTTAYGVDPSIASVHSNDTVTGMGNPSVSGPVTSVNPSGFSSTNFASNPGGVVASSGQQAIPNVSAQQFYMQAATNDPGAVLDWYDLCAGGVVRPYSAGGPCTSTSTIGTATDTIPVRGWKYTSGSRLWTATGSVLDGTYYAHEADVTTSTGVAHLPRFTVIASAQNPTSCSTKAYGNIDWARYDIGQPAYHNLWMFADTDLVTEANWKAGSFGPPVISGMIIAGDQVSLQTSSAGAVGAVVTADKCPTPLGGGGRITTSEVKNPAIYFDPNAEAPFSSVITTSLWLDYSGG